MFKEIFELKNFILNSWNPQKVQKTFFLKAQN